MWKIFLGFVVFAALALFVIFKGGDNLDMGGEKHGAEAAHMEDAKKAAAPAAPAAAPAAPAAARACPGPPYRPFPFVAPAYRAAGQVGGDPATGGRAVHLHLLLPVQGLDNMNLYQTLHHYLHHQRLHNTPFLLHL